MSAGHDAPPNRQAPAPADDRPVEGSQTTADALPVAPSMGPTLAAMHLPVERMPIDRRVAYLCVVAVGVALAAAVIAQGLLRLSAGVTNLAFHGRLSFDTEGASPWDHRLGPFVAGVPVIGAVVIGVMARYGSRAIRGHGIPEAMEKVLTGQSRIPVRVMFLKPLSAAVAIGTGGPFGAEGPIIATGGALGSVVGQVLPTSADERKTLLACGAAAGMAATFGTPVAAVLLAVELLLFEFRPRSLVPVALASAIAAAARLLFEGAGPVFPMPAVEPTALGPLVLYVLLGGLLGLAAIGVTKAVYAVEDAFERLPVHWMWWPAIGAVAVGGIGYFQPRTLGVGYANISDLLSNRLDLAAVAVLCVAKFASWSIYLGSGTSGGTLAPLLTIGGAVGTLLAAVANHLVPGAHLSLGVGALVGMAAMFSGSARALLASVVFAFEATRQPAGLLPLLGGCAAAFLVSALLMRNTIMTEK
ncbi:MAG TPA: chloride channel protein, partial [Humisphaera sp.]